MRRTAGIVVPLVIVVALVAGFAIGRMAGGSSGPSPRIGGVSTATATATGIPEPTHILSPAPASSPVSSPEVVTLATPTATASPVAAASPALSTPEASPVASPEASPGSSPIDTLKP